jgi:hypothetical protein
MLIGAPFEPILFNSGEGTAMGVACVTRLAGLLTLFFSAGLAGCAQVTVISDQAPPQSEWKFGVLAVDVAGSSKNTIVATSGVGLISTPAGATLGYSNARIVQIGDECRVVITTKDLDALTKDREMARRLKATHKACAA